MDSVQFQEFLSRLNEISKTLNIIAGAQSKESGTPNAAEKDKKDKDRLSPREKKIEAEKADIYAKQFKKIFQGLDKKDSKLDDVFKKNVINVNLDNIGRKALKQLSKVLSDSAMEEIKEKNRKEKQKKKEGGGFGFLGLGALTPVILAIGGVAGLMLLIKNADKISAAMIDLLKAGRENIPEILKSVKENLLPFWDRFLESGEKVTQMTIDLLKKVIDQFPILGEVFNKYFPTIREEITKFINETDPLKLLKIGGAFLVLYTAWKAISTVTGITDAIVSPATAINTFNNTLKNIKLAALSVAILGFAKAFEIFGNAVQKFENMDWETLAKAGTALVGFGGAIAFITKMKVGWDAFLGAAGAAGIGLSLALVLEKLADAVKPWNDVTKNALEGAGIALATVLGSLAVFAIPGSGQAAAIGSLFGGAGLLVMGGSFMLAIRGLGETFKANLDVWEKLPGIFKGFADIDYSRLGSVAAAIAELAGALALQSLAGGAATLSNTISNVWNKLTGQKSAAEKIKEFEAIDGDRLAKVAVGIEKLFKALSLGSSADIKEAIKNLNSVNFDKAGNIQEVPPPAQPGLANQGKVAQDFISRPGQPPLMFSSEDNILSFKNVDIFDPLVDKINSARQSETVKNILEKSSAFKDASMNRLEPLFNELQEKFSKLLDLQKEQNLLSGESVNQLLNIGKKDPAGSNVVVNNSSSQMVLTQKTTSNLDFRRGLLSVNY